MLPMMSREVPRSILLGSERKKEGMGVMKITGRCVGDWSRTLLDRESGALIWFFFVVSGASVTYEASQNGSVHANINAVGVVDWGRVYATVAFPVNGNRSILVGWTYVCLSVNLLRA